MNLFKVRLRQVINGILINKITDNPQFSNDTYIH